MLKYFIKLKKKNHIIVKYIGFVLVKKKIIKVNCITELLFFGCWYEIVN